MQHSVAYTIAFASLTCLICAILVSTSAVSLRDIQQMNADLDKRRNVLLAAGLAKSSEKLNAVEITKRFQRIKTTVIDITSGQPAQGIDFKNYDSKKISNDPLTSRTAPVNAARVSRIPRYIIVYQVFNAAQQLEMIVLPIEGYGLWSTLYGFIALDADGKTVHGLTYYKHGETPGLGGEVDNPSWKARWTDRIIVDDTGDIVIEVIKGTAGSPKESPYFVDGLSGATITSRGVTNMLHFWLGENGFEPYLKILRATHETSKK